MLRNTLLHKKHREPIQSCGPPKVYFSNVPQPKCLPLLSMTPPCVHQDFLAAATSFCLFLKAVNELISYSQLRISPDKWLKYMNKLLKTLARIVTLKAKAVYALGITKSKYCPYFPLNIAVYLKTTPRISSISTDYWHHSFLYLWRHLLPFNRRGPAIEPCISVVMGLYYSQLPALHLKFPHVLSPTKPNIH